MKFLIALNLIFFSLSSKAELFSLELNNQDSKRLFDLMEGYDSKVIRSDTETVHQELFVNKSDKLEVLCKKIVSELKRNQYSCIVSSKYKESDDFVSFRKFERVGALLVGVIDFDDAYFFFSYILNKDELDFTASEKKKIINSKGEVYYRSLLRVSCYSVSSMKNCIITYFKR